MEALRTELEDRHTPKKEILEELQEIGLEFELASIQCINWLGQ